MKVKNGIASSSSFDMMPKMRKRQVAEKALAGRSRARCRESRSPVRSAASENATGKPISMTRSARRTSAAPCLRDRIMRPVRSGLAIASASCSWRLLVLGVHVRIDRPRR